MQMPANEVMRALSKVVEYWYHHPEEGELEKAWRRFCAEFNLYDFFGERPDSDVIPWLEDEFEEWYLFSYRLQRGDTPLQRYLDLHLPDISPRLQRELQAVVRTELFSVFGIEECQGAESTVCLFDLNTGKRYPFAIAEIGGRIEAPAVCMRIAKVRGAWHVVGAFAQFLPGHYLRALVLPDCLGLDGDPVGWQPRQVGFVEVGRLMALSMSRYVREPDYHGEEVASDPDRLSEMHQILEHMREEEEMTDDCA